MATKLESAQRGMGSGSVRQGDLVERQDWRKGEWRGGEGESTSWRNGAAGQRLVMRTIGRALTGTRWWDLGQSQREAYVR